MMRHESFLANPRNAAASTQRFAMWWLKNRAMTPTQDAISHVGDFSGSVLYREGQFQVQMWIGRANAVIPDHVHPNMDSMQAIIGGDAEFKTEDNERHYGMLRIKDGEHHSAQIGSGGVTFLSFQKWLNGVQPNGAEDDWVGEPLGEDHHV